MFSANENINLRKYKKLVVEYVECTIEEETLDEGVNVMAMQVSCQAPGCVPIETAIVIVFPKSDVELIAGLPESAGGSYKTKILKPLKDVTKDDVLDALPPSFIGGRRSVEKLCIQARDVMLGQVTQLFEVTSDRELLVQYLQESLQTYMDRGCESPEWGEPFPTTETSATVTDDKTVVDDKQSQIAVTSVIKKTGNVVIQRPIDNDDDNNVSTSGTNNLSSTNSTSVASSSSTNSNSFNTITKQQSRPQSSISGGKSAVDVNTSTRRKQQQSAERRLRSQGGASTLLQQLAQREHAPGVRRNGCPCCDPDNPGTIADQFMNSI